MQTETTIIFIVLGIILLLFIIGSVLVTSQSDDWKEPIKKQLSAITRKTNKTHDIYVLKSLLIEIDTLLGDAMNKTGIKGESTGARLKNAKPFYEKKLYNEIWNAHKLRNKMVHELDYKPKVRTVYLSIDTLKVAIRKLLK